VEKVTIMAFSLGLASILFSALPYHCPAPLQPNGQGRCDNVYVPIIGGSSIPAVASIGLFFCATEMCNRSLRKRFRELKDERRERSAKTV
jgi:hypothetical protein